MANPTSNFGWQMPTATDLVTDLPADFEVFGQAVDTDFVDLLGGTTGQILSKTSATDLDFTWINNDQGNHITTQHFQELRPMTAKTDNYTVASGDEYNIFSMNAATDKEFSIPTDATFNFAIGTEINFFWITGAGQPSIVAQLHREQQPSFQQVRQARLQNYALANSAATAIKLPQILG
jgi:hypothetical protein